MTTTNPAEQNITSFAHRGKKVTIQGFSDEDWIYKSIRNTKNFYEIDLLDYMKYVLRGRFGAVLDVGANIGNHSVFLGLHVCDKIICFEPNPDVLPLLRRNLVANKINHSIFEIGLSDNEGRASVSIPIGHENNVGAAKLMAVDSTLASIKLATLDSMLANIKSNIENRDVIAIKIDVEGMEPNVLRGANETINLYKPELFVEIVDAEQMGRVESILLGLDYVRMACFAATPVWHFSHRTKLDRFNDIRYKAYLFHDKVSRKLRLIRTAVIARFK